MNILVTGANGQLGCEMRVVSCGSADKYIFTDVCELSQESAGYLRRLAGEKVDLTTLPLDMTDEYAVRKMVEQNHVDVIVNCAAYTNVEGAETNYELAERLNADAPRILAAVMKETGGLLVHISTDYVFGKEPYNIPCKEDQQGTPTGVYGLTKLHGEQQIQASGCNYVIIRTAWLYSEFGKNFCKTMLQLQATKPQLKVVFDQVGTPTYALDLAKAIAVILSDYKGEPQYQKGGIYHFSNEGVCSWYDFSKMIQQLAMEIRCKNSAEQHNPIASCDIQPCHSADFPSAVVRPAYSVLDKTKIKSTFAVAVPYWVDSLRQCLATLVTA